MMRVLIGLIILILSTFQATPSASQPVDSGTRSALHVGEEVRQVFASPHPYGDGLEGGGLRLVWQEEIRHPAASYLAPHFSRFDLAPGDYVIVRSPDGARSWKYEGYGKGELGKGPSGFWGVHVPGDTAIVELFSRNAEGAYGFSIDRYARGYTDVELLGTTSEDADDSEWAPCERPSAIYDKSRAVARLLVNGTELCTGFLMGSGGHLLTTNHCIASASDAFNTNVEFMAEGASCATDCREPLSCGGTLEATSATLVKTDAQLDYSLIQLSSSLSSTYGFLQFRPTGALLDERVYVPQHSQGGGRRIAVLSTHPLDESGYAEVASLDACGGNEVGYFVDVAGGSSGSPVLAANDHLVVALHRGACGDRNVGVNVQDIVASLGSDIPPRALAGTSTISGQVTRSVPGVGIAGVYVEMYDSTAPFFLPAGFAVTDATGSYAISGLDAGTYYALTLNTQGFFDELYNNRLCQGRSCDIHSGNPITVAAGATASEIDFVLDKGSNISGRITASATGLPLQGVNIQVYDAAGTYVTFGATDSDGNYTSSGGLNPGTYYVTTRNFLGYIDELYNNVVCVGGFACTITSGTPISVLSNSTRTSIDFSLDLGGKISGAVTDAATGAPLPNMFVEVFSSTGRFQQGVRTTSLGAYSADFALPAGIYFASTSNGLGYVNELYNNRVCVSCDVRTGDPIAVTAGSATPGINFSLDKGGSISGRVTDGDTGAPLQNVTIQFFNASGTFVGGAYADSAGNYTSRQTGGLLTGTYFARTFNSLGYVDELYDNIRCVTCTVTTGTPITVRSPSVTANIDFALDRGGSISGRVTDAATGAPIQNLLVHIYTSAGDFVTNAVTSAAGDYVSPVGLVTGNYVARTFNKLGYVNELYSNRVCLSCDIRTGDPIPVSAGSTTPGINFALDKGGSISGRVTEAATGAPLREQFVSIYTSAGLFAADAATNAEGDYVLTSGLTTGTYFARTANNLGYVDELYNNHVCLSCDVRTGDPIAVTAGSTTPGINFALDTGGSISGRVTDAETGEPLQNVTVTFYNASGTFVSFTDTTSVGSYSSLARGGLPAGTYFARTFNSLGYMDELYDNFPCVTCTVTTGTRISVISPSDTPNINFALNKAGSVSGRVIDTATGAPLQNVRVELYNASGTSIGSAFTSSTGNYSSTSLGGLPSGTYFSRTFNSLGYVNELYDNLPCVTCTVTAGTSISVAAPSDTPNIDFALNKGGSISGRVTDAATGAPLQNQSVTIYTSAGLFVTFAVTNASGDYISPEGLTTGNYFARTFNNLVYVDELYNNRVCLNCSVTTGDPIAVTAGSTTPGINFALDKGGSISGRVTDADTAAPLQNVTVQFYTVSGTIIGSTRTNAAGNYTSLSAGGLPSGTYLSRTFNSLGYVNELYDNIPCVTCTVTTGTPISVTAPSDTPNVNFELNRGGAISGTVTSTATGSPIQGVFVQVYNSSGTFLISSGASASNGVYALSGLPGGSYFVRTSNTLGFLDKLYDNIPCLVGCNVTTGTPVSVTVGSTTSNINFALDTGGRILGTVTNAATGAPIQNVTVQIYNSSGVFLTSVSTNASGAYTSPGLPTGTYFERTFNSMGFINELYDDIACFPSCTITSGTPISVTVGVTTSNVDFALVPGGRVSGTVVASGTGAPLGGARVEVYTSTGDFATSVAVDGTTGAYTLLGLPSGSFLARTTNISGYIDEIYDDIQCLPGQCIIDAGALILVAAGTTTGGIDFALDAGGRISGMVTNAATGAPIQSVTVQIYDSRGRLFTSGVTNASGAYTTDAGLPTGSYFALTTNSLGFINELYDNVSCTFCNITTGTPISVTVGSTTPGVNFSLDAGGRVSGTVTDAVSGAPLANVTVNIHDSTGLSVTTGTTNASGVYTSRTGLPSGSYFVRTNTSQNYINELYDNITCLSTASCNVAAGTPVSVTVGATTSGINFALSPGGLISGRVTSSATGAGVEDVSVNAYDPAGDFVRSGSTDRAGNYTVIGLPAGSFFAVVIATDPGFVDELYDDIPCPFGSCAITTGASITVTAGAATSGINFVLDPGGSVSGAITDADTGAPLPGVTVRVTERSAEFVVVGTAITNALGRYTVSGLPTGTFSASTANGRGYQDEIFDDIPCGACDHTIGTPISVVQGSTTPAVDFALAPGGLISGTVTDAGTGAPLRNVIVKVFDGSGQQVEEATAGSFGIYATRGGLPAGSYFALTENTLGYVDELYDNLSCAGGTCNPATGTPISVAVGSVTSGINFGLSTTPTEPPGKASLISPTGSILTTLPTYTWNVVATSTFYRLVVNGTSGNVIDQVFAATGICSAQTCALTHPTALSFGTYTWYIQTYNDVGYGPFSDGMTFTVTPDSPPGKVTLSSPTGITLNRSPAYAWNADPKATYYYLWIEGPSGAPVWTLWYETASVCSGANCSVTPPLTLDYGDNTWWIQTWNPAGYGLWSDGTRFAVTDVNPPPSTTLVSPAFVSTTSKPTYVWNKVTTATWYYLWVNDGSGNVIRQWYPAFTVCGAGTTCSVTHETALSDGDHTWWVLTWNPTDYGPWSDPLVFQVNTAGGFNSPFRGSMTGWEAQSGTWFTTAEELTTTGVSGLSASASYAADYSNFNYSVRLWREGCSTCATGVMVRGTPNPLGSDGGWASGYGFYYRRDGMFSVQKRMGGFATVLQDWTASAAIVQGSDWNVLSVEASGAGLSFYVNGVLVWSGMDGSYTTGRAGIEIVRDDVSGGNQVWADYAALTSIP